MAVTWSRSGNTLTVTSVVDVGDLIVNSQHRPADEILQMACARVEADIHRYTLAQTSVVTLKAQISALQAQSSDLATVPLLQGL